MTTVAEGIDRWVEDPVSYVLKWVLLAVAIVTFAMLGWTTRRPSTRRRRNRTASSPPTAPCCHRSRNIAGKEGFQRADLMDYGSLYGMGSYFGEDYTASTLVGSATLTQENIAQSEYGKAVRGFERGAQDGRALRHAGATAGRGPDQAGRRRSRTALAAAITALRGQIAGQLLKHDFVKGYTQAYSLDPRARATPPAS